MLLKILYHTFLKELKYQIAIQNLKLSTNAPKAQTMSNCLLKFAQIFRKELKKKRNPFQFATTFTSHNF